MADNPYAAPKAHVADAAAADDSAFIAEGQTVGSGNGWTWITRGWELFKQQPGVWIALVVVLFVIMLVISFIPIVGQIVPSVLGPVFGGGIILGTHALARGEQLEIGHLFAGFKDKFVPLLLVGVFVLIAFFVILIVVALIAGVGMGAMMGGDMAGMGMGSMLFAILIALALSIPVYMALWFAPALVMLNDFSPIEALKTSFSACLKNIVPFLVYGVILFVLGILAAIPFGLGWLVLGPVLAASVYAAYRDIFYAS